MTLLAAATPAAADICEDQNGVYGYLALWESPYQTVECEPGRKMPVGQVKAWRCSDGEPADCIPTAQPPTYSLQALQPGWEDNCDGNVYFNTCYCPSCKVESSDPHPSGDRQKDAGDPVNVTNGALIQAATDLDLGGGLRFRRAYDSSLKSGMFALETSMGAKWRHSLDWALSRETQADSGDQMVRIRRGLDVPAFFVNLSSIPGNDFVGPNRPLGSLSGDFASSMTYTDPDGTRVSFDSTGRVTSIAPVGEQVISVTYNGDVVTYANGNASLTVTYYSSLEAFPGKVESVSDGTHTVTYQYILYDFTQRDFVLLDKVTVPDFSRDPDEDTLEWNYDYTGSSAIELTAVSRKPSGSTTAQPMGAWTWNTRVTAASEPGLDQDLNFSYATAGNVRETTVTGYDGRYLATVSSVISSGSVLSVSGQGGPGYEVPYESGTVVGNRWRTRTDRKGHVTLFDDYDSMNRPRRIVEDWDDDGDDVFEPLVDGYARLTDYLWHPRLNEPRTITRASNIPGQPQAVTTFDYDVDGDASYNQAPTDLLHARVERGATLDATGATVQTTAITRFTYDSEGRVLTEEGPRIGVNHTQHVYDPGTGYRTATRRYLNGPSSSYLETTFDDFDARGNPQTVTDPNGRVTLFTYDAAGRVKTVTPPFSGTGSSTIEFEYDADGRIDLITFPLDSDTIPAPYTLDFGYNAKGELLFIADSKHDAIVYEYGLRNRRTRAALYSGFSSPTSPGTLRGDASFFYGDPGLLEKAYNPLFPGNPSPVYSEFGHDPNGNVDSVVDENGKQDSLLYDALDRLIEVKQTRTATYSTQFDYDPASNVSQVTHGAVQNGDPGKVTSYLTDDLGRLVKVVSPDTGTTIFNYDDAGNLIRKIEAFGTGSARTTLYEYDGLDRLTKIDLPTNPDWIFTYDTDAAKNQKGRLARAESTPSTVTTDLEYTARGQLAKESTTYNARRYDVTYTYDAAGNIATIQTPSGTVMTYRYAGSRVKEVDVTKGTRTETIRGLEWLPFGPLDLAKLPPHDGTNNVVTLDREYNARYQLTELEVTGPSGALVDRDYSYTNTASPGPNDPGPNLDKLVDNLDASESRFYFYDELDRLARATDLTGATLSEYGYDPAGNRTFKTDAFGTTAYSYETGTDRLATATGAEQAFYANDAYGNRIYQGTTPYAGTPTYTYNEQNRLVSTVTSQGTVNAVYDAFGRRVAWQTFRFVYDPAGRILEVSNRSSGLWWGDLVWVEGELLGRVESTGAVGAPAAIPPAIARHLPRDPTHWLLIAGASGSLVLVVLAARRRSPRYAWASATSATLVLLGLACVPTGLEFYWIVTDQIGFPVAMTNTPPVAGDAEVIWRASYEPFGLATEELDPDGDTKQVRMPLRFPGQWWDYGANLHDNFFRTYDPATGRYLEADPIGQQAGANLYAYVVNNPANFIDPLGLRVPEWVPFVGGEAGRVIVDEGCPKNCPIRLKDEDLKGDDSLVPPLPGGSETEADAVYAPRGTIKVPDNFTCAITCQDGRATLRCWPRWWFPGKKPQLFLPGAPLPKGFPENPFAK